MKPPILVTGAAGFIGMHLCQHLVGQGHRVLGVDNLNDYYSVDLKQARLTELQKLDSFEFREADLCSRDTVEDLFAEQRWPYVVHLAAQVGVRYAAQNPAAYIDSNLVGFGNLLEACRHAATKHLVFASSSSVYGGNEKSPFAETDAVDHPISLYAATKRANELMAHSYSHLFQLPVTGVRFFTVYGPWGRPDMALSLFASAILDGRQLRVFNEGRMTRDYTYVGDVATGVAQLLQQPAAPMHAACGPNRSPTAPFQVFNIGNHQPIALLELIRKLGEALGEEPQLELLPMQPGDVVDTCADVGLIADEIGFGPQTSIDDGLQEFVRWFVDHDARQWM